MFAIRKCGPAEMFVRRGADAKCRYTHTRRRADIALFDTVLAAERVARKAVEEIVHWKDYPEVVRQSLKIGTFYWRSRKRRTGIYVDITYVDGKLSISGHIGDRPRIRGACGQIDMEFAGFGGTTRLDEINYMPDWNAEKFLRLLVIWRDWHLNDLHAGCEHQRELGWDKDGGYEAHPSEPCPVCGYKYGTAWLFAEVPEDVVAFLDSLPNE